MTDIVNQMREDAKAHFAEASQWDMAPEDTINWQRGLNANKAANEIETLRQRVMELEESTTLKSWFDANKRALQAEACLAASKPKETK